VPHPARRIEEEIARIDKRKVFATRVPPAHASYQPRGNLALPSGSRIIRLCSPLSMSTFAVYLPYTGA